MTKAPSTTPLRAAPAPPAPAPRRRATPRYSFSGHQTFPFRYAWLPKGVAAVRDDERVFVSPDAMSRLGVGKNMVASIRHWGEATGLFQTLKGTSRLLPLGDLLFAPPPPKKSEEQSSSVAIGPEAGDGPGTGLQLALTSPVLASLAGTPPGGASAAAGGTGTLGGGFTPHDRMTDCLSAGGAPPSMAWRACDGLGDGPGIHAEPADPYLEDPGTLWLLHWRLTSRPAPASTWHLVFTRFAESVFTRDGLADWLLRCAHDSGAARTSPASIRRDLDVFVRTYVAAGRSSRRPAEEAFDCPLVELGLLREVGAGRFELRRQARPSLPVRVLLFATLEFWQSTAPDQRTLPLERLLFDPGSPGAAFRLGDRDLVGMVERFPRRWGIRYDETAGMRLLLRERDCDPLDVLHDYYRDEVDAA